MMPTPTQSFDRKRHALGLFAGLADAYDRAGAVLSLGGDPRWRRTLVANLQLGPGDRVLDVATGTGLVAEALVRTHGCEVVAVDQSSEMLAAARRRVASQPELGGRITVHSGEAERLSYPDASFDALCFTYLLRYVDDPVACLSELGRVVKPGGQIAALEFAIPNRPGLRLGWQAYTRAALPTLGWLFSRQWYEVGRFLGPSITDFYRRYPLERTGELWEAAGIELQAKRRMSLGAAVVMWGVKPDGQATGT